MILYKYAKVPVYCTPSWCVSWKNVFAQSCHTYIIYKKVREWVDEWTELSTLYIGGLHGEGDLSAAVFRKEGYYSS